uniref:Uncharacterized protein n=1 Tax=Acrobeloides nanus TaxID=290746 RepID=A0A914E4Q3_9BILA
MNLLGLFESEKKQSKRLKDEDFFNDDEHEKLPNTMAFASPLHSFPSSQQGSIDYSTKKPSTEAPARPPPPIIPTRLEQGSISLNDIDKKFADNVLKQEGQFKRMTTALKEKLPTEKLNLNFLGNKNTQKLNNDEEIIPHLFGVDECKQTSMSKFKNQARVMDVHKINMHRKKCSFEGKGLLAHDEVQLAAECD